ncbi:MAG: hypothetical protein ACFFD4_07655 [Candidatus Odinarchaeota archaeon]
MTRITAGRASVLGARVLTDTYGTSAVLGKGTAVDCYMPAGVIGIKFYVPNVPARTRINNTASTALTVPVSGYFHADTEYSYAINNDGGTSWLSILADDAASTAEVTWLLGAGA